MPFGFHLAMDTLPSRESILWPTTHYRRLWIWRSSFEHQRDFNPPDQRAAQRTHMDLSEARGLVLFRVVREGIGITQRLSAQWHCLPTDSQLRASGSTGAGGARHCCSGHETAGLGSRV